MFAIVKTIEAEELKYNFFDIDEEDVAWPIGNATQCADNDGDVYFRGDFDLRGVSFDNDEQLLSQIHRIMGINAEVLIMNEEDFKERYGEE